MVYESEIKIKENNDKFQSQRKMIGQVQCVDKIFQAKYGLT